MCKGIGTQIAGEERRWRLFWPSAPLVSLRPRSLLALGLLLLLLVSSGVWAGRRLLAVYHLRAGQHALELYHPQEARPHLEACLRLWSDNAETLLLLARTARRADVFEAAEQYLAEYRQLHGQSDALILEEILHSAAKGETDKVVKHCRQLVQENSDISSLALEALVQGYFRTYRFGEGFAVLQLWQERQPDNTQALLFLAGLYAVQLRRQEAVETYGRLLERDPDHATARLRLAMLLIEDNKHETAMPHLNYLRQRQTDNPMTLKVLVLLARCLDHLGQEDQGEQLREAVLAQHPHFGPALGDRGRWALRQGRWTEAESWLREALASDPDNRELRYQLVQCLFKNGKSTEADSELQNLKRLEASWTRLETIIQRELPQKPGDPALHLELGRLLLEQGQTEEGLFWLHRVAQANPAQAAAHRTLADYYQKVGDAPRAAYHRHFLPDAPSEEGKSTP